MSALSKLERAFQGAAQRIIEPRNLLIDGAAICATVGFALAFGAAVAPAVAGAAAGVILCDAVAGASLTLKRGGRAGAPAS